MCFLVTDTPDRMIAAPVVLPITVLLLGGIVAIIVLLLFKRKKATVIPDSLQFTLTSPTINGQSNIEEKKVKFGGVCT